MIAFINQIIYIISTAIFWIANEQTGVLPSSRSNCATFPEDRGAAGNAFFFSASLVLHRIGYGQRKIKSWGSLVRMCYA